jgi:predicted RNA binding protein YcfA (HicA-like mRNA interferase family)
MPRVTYRQVRHLLIDLGFRETPTKGSHLLYVHPAARAQVMLPRADEAETVLPAMWSGIRRTIFEYGIMDPAEVDERLYSARL